MKNNHRLLAATVVFASASYAAPFLAIDDNAEIFLTGTVGMRADTNVFLAEKAPGRDLDDVIFDFNPGAQLVFGKSALVQGSLNFTESFTRYAEHDELDDELMSTSFNATYGNGKSKASFNASYNELNQNTVDVLPVAGSPLNLIRRDVYAVGSNGEISLTDKSSVAAGVQYQKSSYERSAYSDSQVLTIPVNYYYELTPKVDTGFGYRFRQRWESIRLDSKDHFFSANARGEFTPKLSGQVAIGVTRREFIKPRSAPATAYPNLKDKTLLGIDTNLTYLASPKTTVQFGVSNDFDTNSQGDQQKNLAFRLAGVTNLSPEWSITTMVSYRRIDYYQATVKRIDDYFEGQLGATYIFSEQVNLTAAYAYRTNDSDLATANFDSNVFSLAANFRF